MDGFAKVHLVEMQSYREFCVILKFGDLKEKRKDNETKLFIKNRFLVKKKKKSCSLETSLQHKKPSAPSAAPCQWNFFLLLVCQSMFTANSTYFTLSYCILLKPKLIDLSFYITDQSQFLSLFGL